MSLRLAVSGAWNRLMARPVVHMSFSPRFTSPYAISIRGMASQKHKNLLKHAKGYRGRSKNCFRIAIRRVQKAWQYAYRDRKQQRREWRKLWITRIQAGARQYNYSYSKFMPSLQKSNISLNRKVLSELAANEPFAFKAIVDVVNHETQQQQQQSGK